MTNIAVDTNILLYSLDDADLIKKSLSIVLLNQQPIISSQNISEFINVISRRWKYSKSDIEFVLSAVLNTCNYFPTTKDIYFKAFELIGKYNLQTFDAIIVATALKANCSILYSEDMHHELLIDKSLKIINPFL